MVKQTILWYDNAVIHRANKVQKALNELQLAAVTNCPYAPELNPAEAYIRMHKNILKNAISKGR